MAAASPALAREEPGWNAPGIGELKRQANEAAARYNRARADQHRLTGEISRLQERVSVLERRMDSLRKAATRGAAGLYKRDAIGPSSWIVADADSVLGSARRLKLLGSVNGLAGVAVQNLDEAAGRLRTERVALEDGRRAQDKVIAQMVSERRAIDRRLAAVARAERENQARQAAVARAQLRASRAETVLPRLPVAVPGSFVCPIKGPVAFSNDFGGRRNHKGNDLMNPRGTENVAVVAGMMESRPWGGGAGLTIFLKGDDGHTYIYMHLLRIVGSYPRHVEQGEVIALTGASGNATAYHTHFEYHPGGGPAVNPYPLVSAHC